MKKFEISKSLQNLKIDPVTACSIDATIFALFLGTRYSSSTPLTVTDEDMNSIRSISRFSSEELEAFLKGIANLHSADEDGAVVDTIKHANL